jgi:hypothetical protein
MAMTSEDPQVANLTRRLAQTSVNEDDNQQLQPGGENLIIEGIEFVDYANESQLEHVMDLVSRDLSEPYSSK